MGTVEDRKLISELEKLVEAIDTFTLGVLAGSLSLEDQLAFGQRLLDVAVLVRQRLEGTTAVEGDAP
jgi:hypothetical protein